MESINLENNMKVAVIGDIHEAEEQFDRMVELLNPSEKMLLVSVGDIYDKGSGRKHAESIGAKIKDIVEVGYGYMIKGNHEVKHLKRAIHNPDLATDILWWIKDLPFAVSFLWPNNYRLTVVHGGITPHHTWDDLGKNSELAYVRRVCKDGKHVKFRWVTENGEAKIKFDKPGRIWHEVYDGRFGYIASGHEPNYDGKPKFYKHSCNLDTAVFETGILTGQIFGENGREGLVQIQGEIRNV